MLAAFFVVIYLLIIALVITKTKVGVTLFIAYSLLVPVVKFPLGIPIGENFMYLLIVLVYYIKNRRRMHQVDYKPFKPIMFLMVAYICMIPLHGAERVLSNFNTVFYRALSFLFYPITLYTIICLEKPSLKMFVSAILVSGSIFTLYGIILTRTPGVNPYLMLVLPIFGEEYNLAYSMGYSGLTEGITENYEIYGGRIFGRIFSVFKHPMTYALNLGLFFIITTYAFRTTKKILVPMLLIIGVAILTCGARTPIAAIAISILVVLLYLRKMKMFVYGAALFCIFYFIIPLISPDMADYVLSIVNSKKGDVSGSSLQMRLDQLSGCFDIIRDNPIFGKGLDWTTQYLTVHTVHPKLLAFESLIFVVICNMGIVGVVVWLIYIFKQYKFVISIKDKEIGSLILALFCYYICFTCLTGDYGFMKYFMLYYAIGLGYYTRNSTYEPSERI